MSKLKYKAFVEASFS